MYGLFAGVRFEFVVTFDRITGTELVKSNQGCQHRKLQAMLRTLFLDLIIIKPISTRRLHFDRFSYFIDSSLEHSLVPLNR